MTRTMLGNDGVDTTGHTLVEGPALARVAGLPARSVAVLAAEPLARLLDRIAAARADLHALGVEVAELLYAAVPLMDSASGRRAALRWRRAAHAADPVPAPPALVAEVASVLCGTKADCSALHRWAESAERLRTHRSDLRQAVAETHAEQERSLAALMAEPAVARALSVVSPVFFARMAKDRALDRGERVTAYGYAVRTTLKASPLSSLTDVVVPGAAHGERVRVGLHPLVGRVLLHTAATRAEVRDQLVWRANDSLRGAGGTARLSVPLLSAGDGWAWSHQLSVDARRRPDLSSVLGEPARFEEPGRLSADRLGRYLASGLVCVDDPCPPDRLMPWLAGLLASAPDASGRTAAELLTEAAGHLARIADGTPSQRSQGLRGLDAALAAALRELDAPDEWPLNAVTPVYEDRAGAVGVDPPVGEARRAVLRHAGAACASLRVSDEYQAVTDAFVARFGDGGVCEDVFAFCTDLAETGPPRTAPPGATQSGATQSGATQSGAPQSGPPQTGAPQTGAPQSGPPQTGAPQTGAPQTGAPQSGPPQTGPPQTGAPQTGAPQSGATQSGAPQTGAPQTGPPGAPRPARPGRSSCLPSLAVLYQHARGRDEGPLVVVNQISSGCGAIAARFHRLLDGPGGAGFADRLRNWVATLYPQAECLEFVPAREANPLQADSGGLLPALHWPGTARPYGPGAPVTELQLVHDPDRHALELRRRGAGPVAPVYLGTVPRHLVGGAARVLLTLADPWWLPPGQADGTRTDGPVSVRNGAFPRRSIGRAVVCRAHWRCDSSEVPRRASGEDWPDFLERVDGWRRSRGMPAEVYVRCGTGFPRRDALRKPLWIAFASPVGLEALHRLPDRPGAPVVFTECLPDREDPTGRVGGRERVVEHCLHVARTSPTAGGRH
ncbi:hypothetical protein QCN29_25945 [Streptomyces sp. HNM0663]|uniref:Lantibiotic dehydratase N-terminal domain-containing protein n=1 Tax=Streptomyces chengmaiensis TaxID=3040919 RepID=A0ABT6HV14_9ACTN|nr:hypothetical protein [Streptomyces chengmaiensis]MDH2392162.1 hypothetical protein [Streptomyces chengmaiensis]